MGSLGLLVWLWNYCTVCTTCFFFKSGVCLGISVALLEVSDSEAKPNQQTCRGELGRQESVFPSHGGKEQEAELLIPSQLHHGRSQTDIPVSASPQGLVALLPMEQDRCQMPRQPPTHTPGILGSKGSSD